MQAVTRTDILSSAPASNPARRFPSRLPRPSGSVRRQSQPQVVAASRAHVSCPNALRRAPRGRPQLYMCMSLRTTQGSPRKRQGLGLARIWSTRPATRSLEIASARPGCGHGMDGTASLLPAAQQQQYLVRAALCLNDAERTARADDRCASARPAGWECLSAQPTVNNDRCHNRVENTRSGKYSRQLPAPCPSVIIPPLPPPSGLCILRICSALDPQAGTQFPSSVSESRIQHSLER